MSVSGEGRAGGSSPVLESFLKMATSTVYKMAGLGSFQGSRTQKVSGAKQKKKNILNFGWIIIQGIWKIMPNTKVKKLV